MDNRAIWSILKQDFPELAEWMVAEKKKGLTFGKPQIVENVCYSRMVEIKPMVYEPFKCYWRR